MDYSKMIETFKGVACVITQKKTGDDPSDRIRICAANRNYLASTGKQDEDFVPGRPYTYYVSYDPNFEALVESCISGGRISHQYVNAGLYNAWLDIYMIPLEADEEGNGYCLFTYELSQDADSEKLIDISAKTAYLVLKTCIKFREKDDFVAACRSIVKDIRHQCESDGCSLILTDTDKRLIDVCCFDRSENNSFAAADEDVFFKPEFYDIVESWSDVMAGSNCVIVSNEKELKELELKDPAWYATLIMSKVTSLVLYPLRVGDNLYGYIFATNFNPDKIHFIREVMELNSFILSAEAENFRMRQKLEKFSTTDMLTGVLNRNAMNRRIEALSETGVHNKGGIGVVFVDLNGLKNANDSMGHNEGDEMLKNVAEKIMSVYPADAIYRAGGDEFLIIMTGTDRDDFYSDFEKLKALSRVPGQPAFAIGAHYDDRKDIVKIMNIADQNMYMDKTDYYEANPHMDRRTR